MKPLSITGIAHVFSDKTQQSDKEKYCNINPQIIDERKDLDALLLNHLLDLDLFSKDATPDSLQADQEKVRSDIESSGETEQVDTVYDESSHLVATVP